MDLSPRQHVHSFDTGNPIAERRTWIVVALTGSMMVVELVAGWLFNSMAVFADGWHMSTHAAALGLTGIAYLSARRLKDDRRFAFGPWKIEPLGGFASAILLAIVALYMAGESVRRLFHPLTIHYDQAMIVAALGLLVNLASAFILKAHRPGHDHGHHDLNLKAAYLHVLADATTSMLAIVALIFGKWLHWRFLDPLMGVAGGALISVWAYGLLRDTSRVLLDREMDNHIVEELRTCIEADGDARVSDLHVWRVGRSQFACALSIVAGKCKSPDEYRALLRAHEEIAHATIEVTARRRRKYIDGGGSNEDRTDQRHRDGLEGHSGGI
jgi:cation diffusion facilitator family transporter